MCVEPAEVGELYHLTLLRRQLVERGADPPDVLSALDLRVRADRGLELLGDAVVGHVAAALGGLVTERVDRAMVNSAEDPGPDAAAVRS